MRPWPARGRRRAEQARGCRAQPPRRSTHPRSMSNKSSKPLPPKLQIWVQARKRHRLSHAQVHMARELGLNPKKLGSLGNHHQQPGRHRYPSSSSTSTAKGSAESAPKAWLRSNRKHRSPNKDQQIRPAPRAQHNRRPALIQPPDSLGPLPRLTARRSSCLPLASTPARSERSVAAGSRPSEGRLDPVRLPLLQGAEDPTSHPGARADPQLGERVAVTGAPAR
jgi:hypothetical protein